MMHRRKEDRVRGVAGWFMQPARRGWIAVLFAILLGTFAFTLDRITSDESGTCRIQARGLPVGHELAASMIDIHRLLTLKPTTAQQRKQARETPLAVRVIVQDLNWHLARYQRLEAGQPGFRTC